MIKHLSSFIIAAIFLGTLSLKPAFAEPRVRRNVEVEFETIEGASLYEVMITRKDDKNKKPQRFKSSTPQWSANVKPGLYNMQTRAFDDRGAPGDWSPPTDLKVRLPAVIINGPAPDGTIKASEAKSTNINFSWEPIPGATGYRIWAKGENNSFSEEQKVSTPEWTGNIPVGHTISWNAVAIDENGEDGEQNNEAYQFQLNGPALEKPKIDKPYSKFVQEVTWAKPDYSNRYSYSLARFNPKTKTWQAVEAHDNLVDPKVVLDVAQPSGRYRLAVQAHSPNRDDSPKSQIEFYMEGGFKEQAEFDKAMLRDGITKPSRYYAIASYLFTKVDYVEQDRTNVSTTSFEATGGTGRLGAGYQHPRSKWGGFAIVDLSGFIIQGQNFKFASSEFHATRKMEFGQGGLILFGTGLFYKELPIVTGTIVDGFSGVGKVKGYGPHAGFTYWQPLKSRYGMQLNGRFYYTMLGSAGGGSKAKSALSYQYGLLGSYRLDKNTMGYAGYAFRKDEAKFEPSTDPSFSFAQPGDLNSVSIEGHYINFVLEFSF